MHRLAQTFCPDDLSGQKWSWSAAGEMHFNREVTLFIAARVERR
jgi:hypothetical protein